MVSSDPWMDIDSKTYQKFTDLKYQNSKLKTLIALGGWNDAQDTTKYSDLVSDSSKINKFVSTSVDFLKKYNFDGLDLDWEYPNSPEDKVGFVNLIKALRQAFDPHGFLLTAATAASPAQAEKGYDVQAISDNVDFINMMAYDYHGSWDGVTDHHSPLYRRSFQTDDLDASSTIHYWLDHGASAEKLILGMPIYGQSFKLSGSEHGLLAPSSGSGTKGPYTGQDGYLSFYEICLKVKGGWNVVQDPSGTIGPYAYGDGDWVGYDDMEMAIKKVDFIKMMGLGGAMVWELSNDDFNNLCGNGKWPFMTAMTGRLADSTILSTSTITQPAIEPTSTPPATESTITPPATEPTVTPPPTQPTTQSTTTTFTINPMTSTMASTKSSESSVASTITVRTIVLLLTFFCTFLNNIL